MLSAAVANLLPTITRPDSTRHTYEKALETNEKDNAARAVVQHEQDNNGGFAGVTSRRFYAREAITIQLTVFVIKTCGF